MKKHMYIATYLVTRGWFLSTYILFWYGFYHLFSRFFVHRFKFELTRFFLFLHINFTYFN